MRPKLTRLLSTLSISDYPASDAPAAQPHRRRRVQLERLDENGEGTPRALWHTEGNERGVRPEGRGGEEGYAHHDMDEEEDGDGDDDEDAEMEGEDDGDGDNNKSNDNKTNAPIPPYHPPNTPKNTKTNPQSRPPFHPAATPTTSAPWRPGTLTPTLTHTLPPTPFRVLNPTLTQARALTSTQEYSPEYEHDTAIRQQCEYDAAIRQHVRRPHEPTRARYEIGVLRDRGHGDVGHEGGWVVERWVGERRDGDGGEPPPTYESHGFGVGGGGGIWIDPRGGPI